MLFTAMCLSLVTLQDPQPVAFRIEGRGESRNMMGTREGVSGSSSSVAFVRVMSADSAGGVVLDVLVDSLRMDHQPPEMARQLPVDFTRVATPFRYRIFVSPASDRAVALGPAAPPALAHATATLYAAYNRWPSTSASADTVESQAERAGFGRSRWVTRRNYAGSATSDSPLKVRSTRMSTGTGPSGGNTVSESTQEIDIVRGVDGLPASTSITGSLNGSEAIPSSGISVTTTGSWRYTLTRLTPSRARPTS